MAKAGCIIFNCLRHKWRSKILSKKSLSQCFQYYVFLRLISNSFGNSKTYFKVVFKTDNFLVFGFYYFQNIFSDLLFPITQRHRYNFDFRNILLCLKFRLFSLRLYNAIPIFIAVDSNSLQSKMA
jgi:hypothetical protein